MKITRKEFWLSLFGIAAAAPVVAKGPIKIGTSFTCRLPKAEADRRRAESEAFEFHMESARMVFITAQPKC